MNDGEQLKKEGESNAFTGRQESFMPPPLSVLPLTLDMLCSVSSPPWREDLPR